ncbi:MAG: long-chain fatty acid--CoA ligase [Chloroflexi bacterium]|nr:MAG: long-chain fatty acid--CoA ligase [Chloroflexota bacterium]
MHGLMMDYQLTIDRIVEHANRMHPHKQISTKLPDGSMHRYSYADFYRRVKRLGNVLETLGVQPGDRVGTFGWNNYQHLEMYYAIPSAAAVIHTLNIRLSPEQLAYVVNHGGDKVVFVDGTLLPLYERAAGQITCVERYVIFNAPSGTSTSLPNVSYYEDLMAAASDDYTWKVTDERQAMGLCYTSGTTGNPKGVLYSHRSMFLHTLGENLATSLGATERDRLLAVVPMFHAMAWGTPYATLLAGAEIVLPGPHLQPPKLAELIAEERITIAAGVPTIWMGMYQDLKANPRDVSCIRALVVGGSAMPRALIEAYEKELGVNVVHAWGMTEMSPLGTLSKLQSHHDNLPDHERWDVKARQGYVVPGVEMRIVNDAGRVLDWDGSSVGEVQVRGPWIAKAYYRLEPTEEHFTADGWFRTGDVASITPDGYLQITDRTKDLVKSGGEWISSVELENALMAHPKVAEAAVIAVPDERWSERPCAVVVLAPNAGEVTGAELIEFIAPKFAKFWLPDTVIFVDEIPKTSVGKFDKKVLRVRHAEGALG